MLSPKELNEAVKNRIKPYIDGDVMASLRRNHHMNQYDDESIDNDSVESILGKLVDGTTFGSNRSIDVLMSLKKAAQTIRTENTKFSQDTIDAVLVDFINYVGITCCVDLALYTSDLR